MRSVIPIQQLTRSPLAKFLQAYHRTAQTSLESARTLPAGLGAGPESVPPAAGLHRFPAVHFSFLPPSCRQHGLWPQPSLLVPASPRRRDSCLTLCSASAAPLFSPAPVHVPVSAVRAWGLGAGRRRSPVSLLVSLYSLVRPPVALTWAPQGALPAKQWPPGRRDPQSGRGKDPATLSAVGSEG